MLIERGKRFAFGEDAIGAQRIAEEADEFGLAFDDDSAAQSREHGREPSKLDRVAKALFGVEQDGFAGEGLASPGGVSKGGLWKSLL